MVVSTGETRYANKQIETHITSHHITSHHITSHHITSHHITSHHITSHQFTVPDLLAVNFLQGIYLFMSIIDDIKTYFVLAGPLAIGITKEDVATADW